MSQIIKDKNGKVLERPADTGYHEEGTGPRDADGVPIAVNAAEEDAQGLSKEGTEEFKRQFTGTTTSDAPNATSTKSER